MFCDFIFEVWYPFLPSERLRQTRQPGAECQIQRLQPRKPPERLRQPRQRFARYQVQRLQPRHFPEPLREFRHPLCRQLQRVQPGQAPRPSRERVQLIGQLEIRSVSTVAFDSQPSHRLAPGPEVLRAHYRRALISAHDSHNHCDSGRNTRDELAG